MGGSTGALIKVGRNYTGANYSENYKLNLLFHNPFFSVQDPLTTAATVRGRGPAEPGAIKGDEDIQFSVAIDAFVRKSLPPLQRVAPP
jgi:hypothetical protein